MWINEEIPKEWVQGIIFPLHKKGDQLECANYRGITLFNVTYKVFSKGTGRGRHYGGAY
jgi:hypothetical protein